MTDQELMEQFQMLMGAIESSEQRLNVKMQDMERRLREEIKSSEQRTMVYIENNVSKRIDTLFDGYKLTHEKQWETDRKLRELEARLERLESLQNVG